VTTTSDTAKENFMQGLASSDMGHTEEANDHFRAASKADNDFALAQLGIAGSATSLEEFAEHLQAASQRAPNASEAERAWIASVQRSFDNDAEGSLAEAQRLTELAPDSPRAWLQLASSQDGVGRYESSRESALKAIEVSPGFVPAHVALGNSYLFNEPRNYDKAEEHFEKVSALQPNEQRSHDLLGDLYRAQGDLDRARTAYTRAAELDPDNGSPLQQRGHVNSFLGNFDEARADYQAAISLSQDEMAATFGVYKALVSIHADDPRRAISELEGLVVEIDAMDIAQPNSFKIAALVNIGTIASHHGMKEPARQALDKCQTLMMEQAERIGTEEFRRSQIAQMAYFEGMLANRTGDYSTAEAKAEEFMALVAPDADPRKNEAAHEILGLANLLQGNYSEAIEHYEQTDPSDIYARYHLGLAYEGAGDASEARRIFDDVAGYNFNDAGYALIRKEAMKKSSS
jgi:tetratricopeptide (TPR) repeat protein